MLSDSVLKRLCLSESLCAAGGGLAHTTPVQLVALVLVLVSIVDGHVQVLNAYLLSEPEHIRGCPDVFVGSRRYDSLRDAVEADLQVAVDLESELLSMAHQLYGRGPFGTIARVLEGRVHAHGVLPPVAFELGLIALQVGAGLLLRVALAVLLSHFGMAVPFLVPGRLAGVLDW